MSEVSVLVAFGFGILSFLAPCIFPLVPSILGYIAGEPNASGRLQRVGKTALFTSGFSAVFIASGALVGFFGFYLQADFPWIQKAAGIVLIVFGLHLAGLVKIPFLYRQVRVEAFERASRKVRWLAPFLVGMSFGFGWSPCLGPVLGGILTLAYTSETALYGTMLLGVYSIGLAIPFLVMAFFVEECMRFVRKRKLSRVLPWVERASGALLIAVGVLVLTDRLVMLNQYFEFLSFFRN